MLKPPPPPDRSAMTEVEHGASLGEWAVATTVYDASVRYPSRPEMAAAYRDSILLVLVLDMMASETNSVAYRQAYVNRVAELHQELLRGESQ